MLAVAGFHLTPLRERLDLIFLDATQKFARAVAVRPANESVVIVGIDEETERRFEEPFALWHRHIGEGLAAIARGNPKLVVVDIALPERSYDGIVPGFDAALLRGLIAAKQSNRLVVGVMLDSHGRPRALHNMLMAAVGIDSLGLAYVAVDEDGIARRVERRDDPNPGTIPLLTERIAQKLGLPMTWGAIDFAVGAPFDYIPMHDAIEWLRAQPERLPALFSDRIVFVGKVGPDDDPIRQPLSLARWAPQASAPPGVLLLAQTIRAQQSGRILQDPPRWLGPLIVLGCATVIFVHGISLVWIVSILSFSVLVAGTFLLYLRGFAFPITSPIVASMLGAIVRSAMEALEQRRGRLAVERQFGGYVSKNLLEAILAGVVDPGKPRRYESLGFLYADLRGYTTMTERLPPEQVLALLNRYYEAITPAIHQFDGTIDNFRGDGILAIFGAPSPVPDGPHRAGLAAKEMFKRLDALNEQLAIEGRPQIDMGVGLSAGAAVAGNIGTHDRHGYSAVGDAVNVAARLQSYCKPLLMAIVATEQVARICANDFSFGPLGKLDLAGHTSVEAFGVPMSSK
ncbi:MAG TPA: adenylate/guanylate cyclase domain-containing protein [Burkholderiales bacterium]|nr:adenylate/guanylate cyclase domain-containing protein [Burkholderiales bacterium]